MPIIDSHVHLFTSDHLPHLAWASPSSPIYSPHSVDEYLSEIPPAHRGDFSGFLFVETDRRYTEVSPDGDSGALAQAWKWPIEEVNFVCQVAARNEGLVRGILSWAPMNLGPTAVEKFWRLLDLGPRGLEGFLKGFRYLVQDKPQGTILRKEFMESMDWVWQKGFVFEVGVDVRSGGLWQMEEALEAIGKVSKGPAKNGSALVINHLGKPDLHIPPSELPSHPTFQSWKSLLSRLAPMHPSIFVKLSGVLSELPQDGTFSGLSASQTEDITVAYAQPWVNEIFSIFGPGRVLWGSDWPVCKLAYINLFPEAGGKGAWEWCRILTVRLLDNAGLTEREKEMVWAQNAIKAYRLDLGSS